MSRGDDVSTSREPGLVGGLHVRADLADGSLLHDLSGIEGVGRLAELQPLGQHRPAAAKIVVVIEQDQMKFDKWMNDLVGRFAGPSSPPRPGIPSGPLTRQPRHFVLAVLTGTTHWSLHDNTLTLAKPETGSLTFQADRDA